MVPVIKFNSATKSYGSRLVVKITLIIMWKLCVQVPDIFMIKLCQLCVYGWLIDDHACYELCLNYVYN